jgi:5'(3')-deoxyribonucleotidase
MIDRILLDMDGVLVDFLGGCKKFHHKEYKGHPHEPDKQTEQTSWNIEPVFQMPAKEIWDPLGFEFWSNLEPQPWMQEIVTLLEDRFGDKNICLLTAPIETYGAIDGKRAWIRKHLPQFRRRYLVGPAKEFCASNRHALVDDHSTNIEAFKDAGGHTFLFPAPWNRRFKEHPVVALKEWLGALKTLDKS